MDGPLASRPGTPEISGIVESLEFDLPFGVHIHAHEWNDDVEHGTEHRHGVGDEDGPVAADHEVVARGHLLVQTAHQRSSHHRGDCAEVGCLALALSHYQCAPGYLKLLGKWARLIHAY